MKLGFSTWAMPKIPIDTSLKFLSETGYDGITIATLPQFTTSLDTKNISYTAEKEEIYIDQNLTSEGGLRVHVSTY